MLFDSLSPIIVADLSVRECGPASAPTICFLHGGGVSGWMWHPQVEALQGTYHCLVPDLPEHGLSAAIQPFTIEDAAHRVTELIRERGHGGRAHVIGLSAGPSYAWLSSPCILSQLAQSVSVCGPLSSFGLVCPPEYALWKCPP